MWQVVAIETPTLGDRSYLVHDGSTAFVIDPQRDIDRILDMAALHGVRVGHVLETHLHNDYVTGGYALAQATGARYCLNQADLVAFARTGVRAGDVLEVGQAMSLDVIATPGHTHTHLSYALRVDDLPVAVFTGGCLLYGTVGRPDLLGPQHTPRLAVDQHASAHRLAAALPDGTEVYPTHGFGSFCSVRPSEVSSSTIGQERRTNSALTDDPEAFVAALLASLDVWPAYYAHMAPTNAAGPVAPDLSPPPSADADELRKRIDDGQWVVDLRHRVAFAAGHVAGTLNFGLDGSFVTYLGWLIPWGKPVTLLGDTAEQVLTAQRELARIGIDRPAAAGTGDPVDWSGPRPLSSYPRASFAELSQVRHHRPVVVLDVRRPLEWQEGHLDGAVHIPLHELAGRMHEIPEAEIWVHCAAGYRASIAASMLAAAGRRVVHVDGDFPSQQMLMN